MSDFYTWLMSQKGRDDPVGDMAEDAARDRSFPKSVTSLRQLTGYLTNKGACQEAIEAAREAWREFKVREHA